MASATAGAATNFELLITGRAPQGLFGAIAGSGASVGLLTANLNWRRTLYINLFIAVVAIVGGWLLLERTERDRGASFVSMPVAGAGMFGVFLFLTYYLQLTLGSPRSSQGWRACPWWRR